MSSPYLKAVLTRNNIRDLERCKMSVRFERAQRSQIVHHVGRDTNDVIYNNVCEISRNKRAHEKRPQSRLTNLTTFIRFDRNICVGPKKMMLKLKLKQTPRHITLTRMTPLF
jgi:hypothetical protein